MGQSSVAQPEFNTIDRNLYDLSHFCHQIGAIGRLTTLAAVPVVAGDSMQLDLAGVFRASPLRRNMYLDYHVDLAAFYVPNRHDAVFGDNWVTFLKSGQDEGTTLGTDTMAAGVSLNCLAVYTPPSTALNKMWTRGLPYIWNRYYRDPSDSAGELAANYFTTLTSSNTDEMFYGIPVCHLKRMWNTGVNGTLTTADYRLPLSGGEVDILEFAALQGRYKTEQARDWYDIRYDDLLRHSWGSGASVDSDQRPELIAHKSMYMSGYDVDGTDDASLGSFSGKGIGVCDLSFPWKFFPEHGMLWVVAVVRIPPVQLRELHLLLLKAEPTYKEISGDPDIIARTAPYDLNANEVLYGSGSVALGKVPYAQWYREHPSFAHDNYDSVQGHPFLKTIPTTRNEAVYVDPSDYDSIFSTLQLKHWQANCWINLQAKRYIPDVNQSIFAGVN